VQAAETITALRPVFLDDTANQWKYCDANDVDRLNFDGFALEAGSANTAMAVQLEGIVRGLSSLDVGKKYYVQDDGTIGTSKGTYEILVGIAISATELLILKTNWQFVGSASAVIDNNSGLPTGTVTIPTRAKYIVLSLSCYADGNGTTYGSYVQGIIIPGIINTFTFYSGAISASYNPVTASLSGQTLTLTGNIAPGGGQVAHIDYTIYYFK